MADDGDILINIVLQGAEAVKKQLEDIGKTGATVFARLSTTSIAGPQTTPATGEETKQAVSALAAPAITASVAAAVSQGARSAAGQQRPGVAAPEQIGGKLDAIIGRLDTLIGVGKKSTPDTEDTPASSDGSSGGSGGGGGAETATKAAEGGGDVEGQSKKLDAFTEKLNKVGDIGTSAFRRLGSAAGEFFEALEGGSVSSFASGLKEIGEAGAEVARNLGEAGRASVEFAEHLGVFGATVAGFVAGFTALNVSTAKEASALGEFASSTDTSVKTLYGLGEVVRGVGGSVDEFRGVFRALAISAQTEGHNIAQSIRDAADNVEKDFIRIREAGRAVQGARIDETAAPRKTREAELSLGAAKRGPQEAILEQSAAQTGYTEAVIGTTRAVEALRDAHLAVTAAQLEQESAAQAVTDAILAQKTAVFAVSDAMREVAQAQDNIKVTATNVEAAQQSIASAEYQQSLAYGGRRNRTVEQQLKREGADLAVERAREGLTSAQRAQEEAPEKLAKAYIALEAAGHAQEKAARATEEAVLRDDKARDAQEKAELGVQEATLGLTKAGDALQSAALRVEASASAFEKASIAILDAADAVKKASIAEGSAGDATRGAEISQRGAVNALEDNKYQNIELAAKNLFGEARGDDVLKNLNWIEPTTLKRAFLSRSGPENIDKLFTLNDVAYRNRGDANLVPSLLRSLGIRNLDPSDQNLLRYTPPEKLREAVREGAESPNAVNADRAVENAKKVIKAWGEVQGALENAKNVELNKGADATVKVLNSLSGALTSLSEHAGAATIIVEVAAGLVTLASSLKIIRDVISFGGWVKGLGKPAATAATAVGEAVVGEGVAGIVAGGGAAVGGPIAAQALNKTASPVAAALPETELLTAARQLRGPDGKLLPLTAEQRAAREALRAPHLAGLRAVESSLAPEVAEAATIATAPTVAVAAETAAPAAAVAANAARAPAAPLLGRLAGPLGVALLAKDAADILDTSGNFGGLGGLTSGPDKFAQTHLGFDPSHVPTDFIQRGVEKIDAAIPVLGKIDDFFQKLTGVDFRHGSTFKPEEKAAAEATAAKKDQADEGKLDAVPTFKTAVIQFRDTVERLKTWLEDIAKNASGGAAGGSGGTGGGGGAGGAGGGGSGSSEGASASTGGESAGASEADRNSVHAEGGGFARGPAPVSQAEAATYVSGARSASTGAPEARHGVATASRAVGGGEASPGVVIGSSGVKRVDVPAAPAPPPHVGGDEGAEEHASRAPERPAIARGGVGVGLLGLGAQNLAALAPEEIARRDYAQRSRGLVEDSPEARRAAALSGLRSEEAAPDFQQPNRSASRTPGSGFTPSPVENEKPSGGPVQVSPDAELDAIERRRGEQQAAPSDLGGRAIDFAYERQRAKIAAQIVPGDDRFTPLSDEESKKKEQEDIANYDDALGGVVFRRAAGGLIGVILGLSGGGDVTQPAMASALLAGLFDGGSISAKASPPSGRAEGGGVDQTGQVGASPTANPEALSFRIGGLLHRDAPSAVPFADGGRVRGPGTATSDSIPAMLRDGDYVMRTASVKGWGDPLLGMIERTPNPTARQVGGLMSAIRSAGARFAAGGNVFVSGSGARVPAMLSDGEHVFSPPVVKGWGVDVMHALNQGLPRFSLGGLNESIKAERITDVGVALKAAGISIPGFNTKSQFEEIDIGGVNINKPNISNAGGPSSVVNTIRDSLSALKSDVSFSSIGGLIQHFSVGGQAFLRLAQGDYVPGGVFDLPRTSGSGANEQPNIQDLMGTENRFFTALLGGRGASFWNTILSGGDKRGWFSSLLASLNGGGSQIGPTSNFLSSPLAAGGGLIQSFAEGGAVAGQIQGMMMPSVASPVSLAGGGPPGTAGVSMLDIRTDNGTFRAAVTQNVMKDITNSALRERLTSTGSPAWRS